MKKVFIILFFFSFNEIGFSNDTLDVKIKILEEKLNSQDSLIKTFNVVKGFSDIVTNPMALVAKLLETCAWVGISLGIIFSLIWLLNKMKLFKSDWHMSFIQRLVEKYEEVNILKKNKRILLISHPDVNNEKFMTGILKEFKIVEKLNVTDTFIQPKETYDVVFANYERGGQNQVIILQYLKGEHDCLFYFGQTGSWDFRTEEYIVLNKRVNLANVRAQIYGNLISTLKFHKLTSPEVEN